MGLHGVGDFFGFVELFYFGLFGPIFFLFLLHFDLLPLDFAIFGFDFLLFGRGLIDVFGLDGTFLCGYGGGRGDDAIGFSSELSKRNVVLGGIGHDRFVFILTSGGCDGFDRRGRLGEGSARATANEKILEMPSESETTHWLTVWLDR